MGCTMNFSYNDYKQITEHGLTVEEVNKQISNFKKGFPYTNIVESVSVGNGVFVVDDMVGDYMANTFSEYAKSHEIEKLVPASGAATRMFKDLIKFLQSGEINPETRKVLDNITKFAFWKDLQNVLPKNPTDNDIIKKIIELYGNKPKALIPFHKYDDDYAATALEEHLKEGAQYAISHGDHVNIHFTVSPEYREEFELLVNKLKPKFGVTYNIEMSEQDKSTDTIAVNMDNTPFRNPDGSLLFRPAGHGALIENLNKINADLVFIKNIDNVTTDNLRKDTIRYKKVLAGILVSVQKKVFELIRTIDSNKANCQFLIRILHDFVTRQLGIKLEKELDSPYKYKEILNRPIRVCGVIENIGAPGGGPFWVRGTDGKISLQIVESSQIAPESKHIMEQSKYFNPVDIVCGIRDFNDEKFDLTKYVDENTGFISQKSKDGKDLRAMERPGLWNGAMANWNTIFVLVPKSTFTPAKVASDLLKEGHGAR